MKRGFDILVSSIALLLLGPSMLGIAAIIRSAMGSPVLYRQARVGRDGRLFLMPKFRSMAGGEPDGTGSVSVAGDPRITTIGRLLRRTKLDELPQLWSVLSGDMSMVGPRPDVPGYADRLTGPDRRILSLRPGITGPATIHFRDEEFLLAHLDDPIQHNDEILYPAKTRLNVAYLEDWSLGLDMACLLATLHPTFERLLPAWARRTRTLGRPGNGFPPGAESRRRT